jgi:hypothetical protein
MRKLKLPEPAVDRLALRGQPLAAHHRDQIGGHGDRALQLWRMPGLSWVGIQLRLLIDWPWLNR